MKKKTVNLPDERKTGIKIELDEETGEPTNEMGLGIACQKCGDNWAEWVDSTEPTQQQKICPECVEPAGPIYTLKEIEQRTKLRGQGIDPDKKSPIKVDKVSVN